jgi:hypothetical protein
MDLQISFKNKKSFPMGKGIGLNKLEVPEGFFQHLTIDQVLNAVPTQGYGNLTFQKRKEAIYHYQQGVDRNGPAILFRSGRDLYFVQGLHRNIAGYLMSRSDPEAWDMMLHVVVDDQRDLDTLCSLILHPESVPNKVTIPRVVRSREGRKVLETDYFINWTYNNPDQMPVHIMDRRGSALPFRKVIEEVEGDALDMTFSDYIDEYLERL